MEHHNKRLLWVDFWSSEQPAHRKCRSRARPTCEKKKKHEHRRVHFSFRASSQADDVPPSATAGRDLRRQCPPTAPPPEPAPRRQPESPPEPTVDRSHPPTEYDSSTKKRRRRRHQSSTGAAASKPLPERSSLKRPAEGKSAPHPGDNGPEPVSQSSRTKRKSSSASAAAPEALPLTSIPVQAANPEKDAPRVVLIAYFILSWPLHRLIYPAESEPLCKNPDCIAYAEVMKPKDESRDPCDDFANFVCHSAYAKPEFVTGFTTSVLLGGLYKLARELSGAEEQMFSWPGTMIRKCRDLGSGNEGDLGKAFADFVHDKIFGWPTQDEPDEANYSRPLIALLELEVNWGLPLWFHLDLLPRDQMRGHIIRMSPSAFGNLWYTLHQVLTVYPDVYPIYVDATVSGITKNRPPSKSFHTFIRRSEKIQSDIFGNLSATTGEPLVKPLFTQLRTLPSYLSRLTVGDWVNALRSVYDSNPPITADDVLYVTNDRVLNVMETLFSNYTAQELLYHTIWWASQSIALVKTSILRVAGITSSLEKGVKRVTCAVHARSVYHLLFNAISQSYFNANEQRKVIVYLDNIRRTAIDKLNGTVTLENDTKAALTSALTNTTTSLWLPKIFNGSHRLEDYYGPVNSSWDFFGTWLERRRYAQRFKTNMTVSGAVATLYRYDITSLTSHDAILNTISIAFEALGAPAYYKNGTSAMVYGSLGSIYAMELPRLVSSLMVLRSNENRTVPSASYPAPMAFWNTSSCERPGLLFPELPALSLAHTAYERFRVNDYDLRLKNLEQYSPQQLFFMSFCRTRCDSSPITGEETARCNEAMKNFEPFAKAFSCPKGSKMNPLTKCQFF
ncbi:hypothetical protein HPB48_005543 [Haemaphysalis longicornis]|uniref:Peptidase M13 C-terminal domain-containing protein n=1 Tax=Haemaphysalis longicornis TaxID=44386 RepID=A0A9J6H2A2_HAELO|nr:hypothetical protein HPB48_005543 [Haemaphysalis longicornis]